MTRAKSTAERFRWLLLVLAVLSWLGGLFYILNVVWPQWSFFARTQRFDMPYGAGLFGVLGFWWEQMSAYLVAVAVFAGVFLLSQWFFLGPRRWWRLRLAGSGRPMGWSVLAAALMAALLSVGLLATLLELPGWWEKMFERAGAGLHMWPVLLMLAGAWFVWACIFALYWRQGDRYTQLGRVLRGLFAGSILELLVATPAHIWVARERECYCVRGTYTGLVLGVTVLLWTFGPGLVLLFLREKYRREKLLGTPEVCPDCGYDLRGTHAAGISKCPECGAAFGAGAGPA